MQCSKLLHMDDAVFKVFSGNSRRHQRGSHEDFCPLQQHQLISFPALHVSYLGFSWGWLVSFVCPCFLLSSSRFVPFQKVVQGALRVCVCVLSACLRMNGVQASPSVTAGDSDLDGTPSRGDEL